jgi:ADP-dependent NAD(P)H-hydrate dehydratase / NAD(P)H-hydrate epimerase
MADARVNTVWTRNSARAVDDWSTQVAKIDPLALMETAGRAVGRAIEARQLSLPKVAVVLCGRGNNGGDALVVSRYLATKDWKVTCVLIGHEDPAQQISPSCSRQLQSAKACELAIEHYRAGLLRHLCRQSAVIIDGIFGIGFRGEITDALALSALSEAAAIRQEGIVRVVAIDIPSGLAADSARPASEPLLPADLTVTFGAHKIATLLQPARNFCGKEVVVADIGFPKPGIQHGDELEKFTITAPAASQLFENHLPWADLPQDAHKFDRGHILIIGGSSGKTGALQLAAQAALRSGCGWVTIASPASLDPATIPPWLVTEDLFKAGTLSAIELREFILKRHVRVLIVGPGMMDYSFSPELIKMLRELTIQDHPSQSQAQKNRRLSVIVDAGAIQTSLHDHLQETAAADHLASHWILTPHPGEWLRLSPTGLAPPIDPATMFEAQEFAQRLHVTLVHKGANPIIFGGKTIQVANYGDNRLAKAGVGDVVAGATAAHLCSGTPAPLAFARAYATVAAAAQELEIKHGHHGIMPDLLAEQLRPDRWPKESLLNQTE